MPSILDKRFKYVPSTNTDIAKTIRREQKRLAKQREAGVIDPVLERLVHLNNAPF